ncbi:MULTISPECIES: Holliday junction resolvase RuvX [Thalassospira]|jgi:putative Holliday junction resolvase|uniref:Putative pre-16S rRNA nuclease n=1 Tax=Thalassospira xiamenensis TaxID=220697 RepID=A0ABR5XWL7_9PROT|nr:MULTISPECIES: Holliday junction resolvase RuvX [Thalassospira]MAL30786.1 Holliday junction resolvase RuvX [Thalassospira sp.]MBR9779905.1 Holliday junction resolvase RuvX [Rhodospirillales bacterium]KZC97239.1 crossover junction endodeoxyribonuclease RuvA [Thalassospira xiamenensis]KZD10168.1 crossover junction endodeoxyribonuclease RuvA [Thalassospira xiamenensis]MBL4839823.1 Holliday junction resolvase RuvX [Thalassospira sp.]|tara:strand:+ start:1036 stop:1566 length:531 start_codon:yes stop_codon:yes gene_type:complete
MICNDTQELLRFLTPAARVLGLDLGTKTIGVALSDVGLQIASPYSLISRKKFTRDIAELSAIVTKQNVGGIIIGFPRELDGTVGKACHRVYAFVDEMQNYIDLPILLWDERLSTNAVERILIEDVDMTRKRRAQVVDKTAAAYILQGALDNLNLHTDPGANPDDDDDEDEFGDEEA